MKMMNSNPSLVLGYDLDKWRNYGLKEPIAIDISPDTNSHILLCGMSGSGKSYAEHQLVARLIQAEQGDKGGEYLLADYKADDPFSYLRDCPRFFPYKAAFAALDDKEHPGNRGKIPAALP